MQIEPMLVYTHAILPVLLITRKASDFFVHELSRMADISSAADGNKHTDIRVVKNYSLRKYLVPSDGIA